MISREKLDEISEVLKDVQSDIEILSRRTDYNSEDYKYIEKVLKYDLSWIMMELDIDEPKND